MSMTPALANHIATRSFDDFSLAEKTVAKHCLLDYLGVALAGRDEPLVRILYEAAHEEGFNPQASLVGEDMKVSISQACLINGSAAHAHDYDDVHMAMSGHPTVPVAPAVLALAEKQKASGVQLLQALVTGLETECLLGRYVGATHYRNGFHATGTLGSFGAAAGCANLLGLDAATTGQALGIAATQASGLKSMFGTMCKPFHAGKAAANGLMAAVLANRGFTSHPAGIETEQGFGSTHSQSVSPAAFEAALGEGNHVPAVLFKYHAACYLTHSAMEGARYLMATHGVTDRDVAQVDLRVDSGHFSVCNIQNPATGLEAKFSLRFATAMILCGVDTASIDSFNDALTRDPRLVSMRDRVKVMAFDQPSRDTHVAIRLNNGTLIETDWNVAVPEQDLALQGRKLSAKYRALAVPVIGDDATSALLRMVLHLESQHSLDDFFKLVRGVLVRDVRRETVSE